MADEALIERDELRREAHDMLADLAGATALRERIARDVHGEDPLWPRLVEVGWAGIEVAEDAGGAGADFGDLAVVLVELGRTLAPGSLFSSAVLAAGALDLAGSAEQKQRWLPGLADGGLRGTAALADASGGIAGGGFRARRDGDGWVLDGTAGYVPDAAGADLLVLRATGDDGNLLVAVAGGAAGLDVRPAPMLDLTRSFDDLVATGLRVPADGVLAAGSAATRTVDVLLQRAAVATACDSLGIADEVLARTVEYLKQRVQFGRPIGSFQALKHRSTDLLIQVETARLVVADAAEKVAGEGGPVAASRAKSYAGDAAAAVAAAGVQMHGGIGVTWEHDAHLFLKRAVLNQSLVGDSRWHRRRLADMILPGRS
jgi:alkylation response protein AidB-like acyl-CoA dehydrogenase